jgi:LysM repeat protein
MRLTALVVALFASVLIFTANGQQAHANAINNENETTQIVVVNKGDSLSKIAKSHNTTYQRLFDANTNIKDPDLIYAGDKIRIPGADEQLVSRTPATPTATAKTKPKAANNKPAPKKAVAQPVTTVNTGSVWDRLAQCESGGNWAINTGNGYYGGLQFSLSSWRAVGGTGYPHQASKSDQIAKAVKLQSIQGWGAWPACTAKLGIR